MDVMEEIEFYTKKGNLQQKKDLGKVLLKDFNKISLIFDLYRNFYTSKNSLKEHYGIDAPKQCYTDEEFEEYMKFFDDSEDFFRDMIVFEDSKDMKEVSEKLALWVKKYKKAMKIIETVNK